MPSATRRSPNASIATSTPPLSASEFGLFSELIRRETGISLVPEKRELLRTRLRKRLASLKIPSFAKYYEFVSKNDANGVELLELINCVTTNKTDFFRESHHFSFLTNTVFPELETVARKSGTRRLRIWSAACSSGQEPYSIAMTCRDHFSRVLGWDVKILASDIDSNCLKKASAGVYDVNQMGGIPVSMRKKYFLRGTGKLSGKVAVRPELRKMIQFGRINFADEQWPLKKKFDVIFCRNAMIYFDRDFQQRLLEKFIQHLSPSGYLILGHSENVTWMKKLKSIGKTIYRPRAFSGEVDSDLGAEEGDEGREAADDSADEAVKSSQAFPAPVKAPEPKKKLERKAIIAGEYFVSGDPLRITTLLGSCIAACLYDPEAKIGGMNHFVLPEGHGDNSGGACFGINAMELLINSMMRIGADRNRLVAKLYGGGQVLSNQLKNSTVGAKNTAFVRNFLTLEDIPILEECVGGKHALRVALVANTGEVVATPLNPAQSKLLSKEDQKSLQTPTKPKKIEEEEQITFF